MKSIAKILIAILIVGSLAGCTAAESAFKNFQSQTSGLDRDVFVTLPDGTTMVFSGERINVDSTEYGNKVILQIDGKRLAVYNAAVTVIEQGLEPQAVYEAGDLAARR